MRYPFLTPELHDTLLDNGRKQQAAQAAGTNLDLQPVVKLFTPDAGATWLLTEIDPDDPRCAFGLCDLGFGCPELGWVDLDELTQLRGVLGLPVERDLHFKPAYGIAQYADLANQAGAIQA